MCAATAIQNTVVILWTMVASAGKKRRVFKIRTIEDVKKDIEFVKQDLEECKKRGYSTIMARLDLEELTIELRRLEREENAVRQSG